MPRTHQRTEFFKYSKFSTAKIVIESRSIRWSAPTSFNDPFDTQTGLRASPFDVNAFAERLVERLGQIVFDPELPAFVDPGYMLHVGALLLRRVNDRLPRQQVLAELLEEAQGIGANMGNHLLEFSDTITQFMIRSRVFCLTEDPGNVVMWSHYAEEHRGVVFKFRVLEDIDHPFLIARKVDYDDEYINLGDSHALADHLSRAREISFSDAANRAANLKHRDWSYEREWRCSWPLLDEPDGDGYMDAIQDPRLFEAIYLGCRMSPDSQDEIIQCVRDNLPGTKVFKATKSRISFDLEFKELVV